MLGNIGPLEILIILIIALVIFGPKRLPELGSSLGRGIREFRDALSGDREGEDGDVKRLERPGEGAEAPSEKPGHEAVSDKRT